MAEEQIALRGLWSDTAVWGDTAKVGVKSPPELYRENESSEEYLPYEKKKTETPLQNQSLMKVKHIGVTLKAPPLPKEFLLLMIGSI